MSRTPQQVSQAIRERLKIIDNSMVAEIGSPERKIIDAASEVISESYMDSYILSTGFDLDMKSGVEIDELLGLFGFGRQAGQRSEGTIRLTSTIPVTSDQVIQSGTVVYYPETDVSPRIEFTTTTIGIIPKDHDWCEVEAECNVASVVGNVAANTIIGIQNAAFTGSVTNPAPFRGGLDPESDEQYIDRYKETFLRNLAGTEDFYAALCFQGANVSKVRVVGPTERYVEQLQIGTEADDSPSDNQNTKFVWPDSSHVYTDLGGENEEWFTNGIHYTFDPNTNPPTFNPSAPELMDRIVTAEYEYTPLISRNDPQEGITNKVDVFANGSNSVTATEVRQYEPIILSNSTGTFYDYRNFRLPDHSRPASGGRFLPLTYVPTIDVPESIVVDGVVKRRGTDYYLCRRQDNFFGSVRETAGIYSRQNLFNLGTQMELLYNYNRVPEMLNAIVKESKQITTDVLVHEPRYRYFIVNLVIAYDSDTPKPAADEAIRRSLTTLLTAMGYDEWLQSSDIEAAVHSIAGVDAVRVSTPRDNDIVPGINEVTSTGHVIDTHFHDIKFAENELPILWGIKTIRRSQNTFARGA